MEAMEVCLVTPELVPEVCLTTLALEGPLLLVSPNASSCFRPHEAFELLRFTANSSDEFVTSSPSFNSGADEALVTCCSSLWQVSGCVAGGSVDVGKFETWWVSDRGAGGEGGGVFVTWRDSFWLGAGGVFVFWRDSLWLGAGNPKKLHVL